MSNRMLLTTLALVVTVLATAATTDAEVVRLRNGHLLQGEIDGALTTDEAITITLYRDGAVLRVLWNHVLGRDSKRLREALGLDALEEGTILTDAHLLILSGGDELRGLVKNREAAESGAEASYQLKTAKGVQDVARTMVKKVDDVQLPLLDIYTIEEAVANKVAEIGGDRAEEELIGQDHKAIADFCYKIGAYAEAKTHYELALEDENFPDRTEVENRLPTLGFLIQTKEAARLINEIKRLQFIKRFREALDIVTTFREQYGTLPKVIAHYKLDTVEKRLTVSLKNQRIVKVSTDYFRLMTREIVAWLRANKDSSIKEAQAFAQKDLTKLIVDGLGQRMDIDTDLVLELWTKRKAKAHTATYGYGTFAAPEEVAQASSRKKSGREQLTSEEIRRRALQRFRQRQKQGAQKEEKPKTAAQWWDKANSISRKNWLTAFYVENGGASFDDHAHLPRDLPAVHGQGIQGRQHRPGR